MISVNKFCILFLIVSINSYSQNALSDQYLFAKKLYDEEKYFDAITELKRLLFFDIDKAYDYEANQLIGHSYKMGGKFSDAIRYFSLAEITTSNEIETYQIKIEIIKLNLLRRTVDRTHRLLDELENDNRFAKNNNDIIYWRGWAYIFNDEWEEASSEFAKIDSTNFLYEYTSQVSDSLYSPAIAKIISYIIPGAGQIYTGEYVSGFLSLGWNVLLGYLSINSLIEDRIFDGLMTANFLWLRFYTGNIQNAEKFVLDKNQQITNRALDYLQNHYNGQKP